MRKIELNKADVLSKLDKNSMFKTLWKEEKEKLMEIGEVLEYDDNEVIVSEGSPSSQLFAILKGTVNVNVKKPEGTGLGDVHICDINEGDVFGESAIFIELNRTATVTSSGKVELLKFERDDLFNFIKEYTRAGVELLVFIVYSLIIKLREANQEIAFDKKLFIQQKEIDKLLNSFHGKT
ncbi:cyclic nucleotide-binding domain-containing protein [Spirochaetota bacterium]